VARFTAPLLSAGAGRLRGGADHLLASRIHRLETLRAGDVNDVMAEAEALGASERGMTSRLSGVRRL
jgi:hypothetical protein